MIPTSAGLGERRDTRTYGDAQAANSDKCYLEGRVNFQGEAEGMLRLYPLSGKACDKKSKAFTSISTIRKEKASRPRSSCAVTLQTFCSPQAMGHRNVSVTEFRLLGFQRLREWQALLFVLFLSVYLLTVTGNLAVITVVRRDRRLHSPMYSLLQHLSFLEVGYTSTIVPLLLAGLLSGGQAISFSACITQLYFFVFLGATECFLLAMMAYDRFLAICRPLHYSVLMSPETCTRLVTVSWTAGLGTGFLPSLMISQLDFCGPNQIDHFFCDLPPLMQLSCSSVYVTEMAVFLLSIAVLCICFFLTLTSYVFIVSSILGIPSASGRMKTFSTCGSHLAVVTIYYGTMISMYVRPNAHLSPEINKIISVFYTVVTPLLNPVIYSLRNKDFKAAVRKVIGRKCGIYGERVKGSFFIR